MSEFKPGDVVMLRSGGPQMVVRDISNEGVVAMDWFNEFDGVFAVTHRRVEVMDITFALIERQPTT